MLTLPSNLAIFLTLLFFLTGEAFALVESSLHNSAITHLTWLGKCLQQNNGISNADIEGAHARYVASYKNYLNALHSVKTQFSGDLSDKNLFSRRWDSAQVSADMAALNRLPIVPTESGLTELLPKSLLNTALRVDINTNSGISGLYTTDIHAAAEVIEVLKEEQKYVNGTSLLLGAGAITTRAISLGATKATVIYISKTGVTQGASAGVIYGGNYALDEAVKSGAISQDAATLTRLGIQAASLYLTYRAASTTVPKTPTSDAANRTLTSPASAFERTHGLSGNASTRNVQGLMDDMRVNGWQGKPIDVFEHNGSKYILDGHHRVEAARRVGIDVPYNSVPASNLGAHGYNTADDVIRAATEAGPVKVRVR